jgi:glycosyltransferase involved in cell wall biosynthesis
MIKLIGNGMVEPTVSVIIPCFNREKMVGEAIQSAVAQGDTVEIIVIDDGSTDGSWQVISSFDGIIARQVANSGVSAARNLGLELARGRYIKFLDSDDLLPEGAVKTFVELQGQLKANEIAVGVATVSSTALNPPAYGFGSLIETGPIPGPLLLREVMPCGLPLFPIAVLKEAGGFDETLSIGEDYELAARLHALGYRFIQYRTPAYIVRDHNEPRLSRRYGAEGFTKLLMTYQTALGILGGISRDEREAVGQALWILGREASRGGVKAEAGSFFDLAEKLGGDHAKMGAAPIKLLYRFMSPYYAERILMLSKRLLRRA